MMVPLAPPTGTRRRLQEVQKYWEIFKDRATTISPYVLAKLRRSVPDLVEMLVEEVSVPGLVEMLVEEVSYLRV